MVKFILLVYPVLLSKVRYSILVSRGNMFQPKTLQCYAAQVILDKDIHIGNNDIPRQLHEDMMTLKDLKWLKEEKDYLTQKLYVLQAKKEESQIEEERFDALAQVPWSDQNLTDSFLVERDFHAQLGLKLEFWEENTQDAISSNDSTKKSLIIHKVYQNITFKHDFIKYDMDFDDACQ